MRPSPPASPAAPGTSEVAGTRLFHLGGVDLAVPEGLASPGILGKLAEGTYEADEARAVERCVRPGFRVLELGAGIGYVGIRAALRTDPALVLSVEADADLLPVIRDNQARNGVAAAGLLHGAVAGAARPGAVARFRRGAAFTASRLCEGAEAGGTETGGSNPGGAVVVEVPLLGFHDLLRAHRPHVVLIDVEGAEAGYFDRLWDCPLRFAVIEIHPRRYGARVVKRIVDAMSAMDMTYDPATSRGRVLGFRRVWGGGEPEEGPDGGPQAVTPAR